ncbi:MAG: hypothetical protein HY234_10165 [Acidobacteria bacterium]|nr:hypothetical protein [Acidobacteriota bacterium]
MSDLNFKVAIRPTNKPGALRAHADVQFEFPNGTITLLGFAVIQKDGMPPWVGLPSKPGNIQGKFFPVIEVEGPIRERILKAILDAFNMAGVR